MGLLILWTKGQLELKSVLSTETQSPELWLHLWNRVFLNKICMPLVKAEINSLFNNSLASNESFLGYKLISFFPGLNSINWISWKVYCPCSGTAVQRQLWQFMKEREMAFLYLSLWWNFYTFWRRKVLSGKKRLPSQPSLGTECDDKAAHSLIRWKSCGMAGVVCLGSGMLKLCRFKHCISLTLTGTLPHHCPWESGLLLKAESGSSRTAFQPLLSIGKSY